MRFIIFSLNLVIVYAVLAAALNLAFGYGRVFFLTVGTAASVGGYTTIILGARHGWPFLAGLAIAALIGLGFGLLQVVPAIRAPGEGFAVIAVAVAITASEVFRAARGLTGGVDGIGGLPPPGYPGSGLVPETGRYLALVLIVGILVVLALTQIARSRVGLLGWASSADGRAAGSLGWNPRVSQTVLVCAASTAAAIGGALYAGLVAYIGPTDFSLQSSFLIFSMMIFGGTRNLLGAIMGAVVIVGGPQILVYFGLERRLLSTLGLEDFHFAALQAIIFGAIVLAVILLKPHGIIPRRRGVWTRPSIVRRLLGAVVRRSPAESRGQSPLTDMMNEAEVLPPSRIEVQGIHVAFGGTQALREVNLAFNGEGVTGIIGPNGAGKSTFLNVLAGDLPAQRGRVIIDGDFRRGRAASHRRARAGLGRTFQELRLFEELTALENVLVAVCGSHRTGLDLLRRPSAEDLRMSEAALARVGLDHQANRLATDLSFGERRLLSIARVLAISPRWVCLDEPGAGAGEEQIRDIGTLIRDLRGQGVSILLIDHKVELIWSTCDRVIVMDQGLVLTEGTPETVRGDSRVIAAYLGEDQ